MNPSPPEFPANREKYREFREICLKSSDKTDIRAVDKAQANMAATGTALNSRPMTTMPDSVTCHPRARSASRS